MGRWMFSNFFQKFFAGFVFLFFVIPSKGQIECAASADGDRIEGTFSFNENSLPQITEKLLLKNHPEYSNLQLVIEPLSNPHITRFEVIGRAEEDIFRDYFQQQLMGSDLHLREYHSLVGPSGKNIAEMFNRYYQSSQLSVKLNSINKKTPPRPYIKLEKLFSEEIADYFAQISNEVYLSGKSFVMHRRAELSFDAKVLDVYYVFPKEEIDRSIQADAIHKVLGQVIFFEKGVDANERYRFLGLGHITMKLQLPKEN